jgi:hypothetical protein
MFDVNLDASFLEDGDGGGRELVGNENARSHVESLGMSGLETAKWMGRTNRARGADPKGGGRGGSAPVPPFHAALASLPFSSAKA